MSLVWALLLTTVLISGATAADGPSQWTAALNSITAGSLEGDVSFLASDILRGRDTPSPGLDVAAVYIASRFRAAGLEPIGDDGYFQTAEFHLVHEHQGDLTIRTGHRVIRPAPLDVIIDAETSVDLTDSEAVVMDLDPETAIDAELEGKIVILLVPGDKDGGTPDSEDLLESYYRVRRQLQPEGYAALVVVDPEQRLTWTLRRPRLIDPQKPPEPSAPTIAVTDREVATALERALDESVPIGIQVASPAPAEEPVRLRNVVGLLRGSDPALSDTAVLLSAHYDHVGICAAGPDRICNGANDDASGTATVIEVARALATHEQRPRRSLVFAAFFGEERELLGSRYYAAHAPFPLEKTVAAINLEQMGRTDSSEGPQLKRAAVTGYEFSDVGEILREAGKATGIEVFRHKRNSKRYFPLSDNIALAERGIPAHTVSVAYQYPDYHRAGDEWDKIDYQNMAAVARMVAFGMVLIGDRDQPPRWDQTSDDTKPYREARAAPAAGQ